MTSSESNVRKKRFKTDDFDGLFMMQNDLLYTLVHQEDKHIWLKKEA